MVSVSVGGKAAQRMRAEIADPEDRKRLWPLITADHLQLCRLSAQDRTRDTRGTAPPGGEGLIFHAELRPSYLSPERLQAC